MFRALGRVVIRGKWLVIAIWVALTAGMLFFVPGLSEVGTSSDVAFLPNDAPSRIAQNVLADNFPQMATATDGLIVFYDSQGLTAADRQYASTLGEWLHSAAAPPQVGTVISVFTRPDLQSVLVSKDGTTMLTRLDFTSENYSDVTNRAVEQVRAHIKETRPANLEVDFTGQAAIGRDLFATIIDSVGQTTWVTILLVVVVLLFIYRSPLAAAVPLVTIGIAFLITRGILALLVLAGMKVSTMVEAFMVVLIFGAGTDYALFLISRYREEVAKRRDHDRMQADIETVARIGPVITASGSTVIIGTLGLVIARFEMTRTVGPSLSIGIAIALLASLTLTPALLSVLGKYLFWPFHEQVSAKPGAAEGNGDAGKRRGWERVAAIITARPAIAAIVVTAVLLVPYMAVGNLTSSFDVLAELPANTDSRQGFETLKQHFDQGELLPITVVLTGTTNLQTPAGLGQIDRLQAGLAAIPNVDKVRSILNPSASQDTSTTEGLLAYRQVLTMSAQLRQSLGSIDVSGGSVSTGTAPLAQLDWVDSYLTELAGAFPQVSNSPSLQSAQVALNDLSTGLAQMLKGAQVSDQLNKIAAQMDNLSASLSAPAPTPQPQAQPTPSQGAANIRQQLTGVYNYLQELAGAYPEATDDPGYKQAVSALITMSAMQSTDRTALGQAVGNLKNGLNTLNKLFEGRDAPFVPKSLQLTSADAQQSEQAKAAIRDAAGRLTGSLDAIANLLPRDAYFLPAALTEQQPALGTLVDAFLSPNRDATQIQVLLANDPYGTKAVDAMDQVDQVAQQWADRQGFESYVAGVTVQVRDIHQIVSGDLPRVMALVVSGVLLVFVILLASLVAPIYLVGTVLLSYGTTMGLSAILFQWILGQAGVNYVIPIIIFVLLVALGADYNIFLISRVWEESSKEGSVRDGVRRASAYTGGVITSAGIILAGTFAALSFAPMQTLSQVGAIVAIGVLVDTFIVRGLLVPAIAALLGRFNWWPARQPAGSGGVLRAIAGAFRTRGHARTVHPKAPPKGAR